MSKTPISTVNQHPSTLVACVYTPYNLIQSQKYYRDEFLSLIKTLGTNYHEILFIKLRNVDKNTFLTSGKLQELVDYCEQHEIKEIIFSEILSPLQERNIEDATMCTLFDRERLILEIFKKSAKTFEGKIQVEMAEINYLKTRLIGKGKEYAQQAGFIGTRGPGETIKEEIRRHFVAKIRQSQKRLITLQKSRETQRKQRFKSKQPQICIIGYTNAGKSSLLNRLTKSDVLAEDKLFATLDTTTRELYLGPQKKLLLSDTVGFISQLPHSLIEAFKSTLDELSFASLLLHVVDISNPAWKIQIEVVEKILKELNIDNKSIINVFNKSDLLSNKELEEMSKDLFVYQPYIIVHTRTKEGIISLIQFLSNYKFEQGNLCQ
jgi:GTPase